MCVCLCEKSSLIVNKSFPTLSNLLQRQQNDSAKSALCVCSNKVAVFLSSGLPSSSGRVCVYVCVNPGLVVDWKINRCSLHQPSQMESVTRVSLFAQFIFLNGGVRLPVLHTGALIDPL